MPLDLSDATFPRTESRLVAERCTWTCDKATEVLVRERIVDEQDTIVSTRETLEQDMGRTILRAVRGGEDSTARFVVPVGTEEVDDEMSLKPLNARIRTIQWF